jgi:hypothetical protein
LISIKGNINKVFSNTQSWTPEDFTDVKSFDDGETLSNPIRLLKKSG